MGDLANRLLVLLGGAAVTIAFTFFFGMESPRAQTMMTRLSRS